MRGKLPAACPRVVEPLGVVTRRSTDVLAVADRQVAAALRFIREHASDGINVEDVLDHLAGAEQSLPLSRSTLDRRFAQLLGRSPKDEILRVRLARVRQLLIETDYTLPAIAPLAGMDHAEYVSVLFKAKTGKPPAPSASAWAAALLAAN